MRHIIIMLATTAFLAVSSGSATGETLKDLVGRHVAVGGETIDVAKGKKASYFLLDGGAEFKVPMANAYANPYAQTVSSFSLKPRITWLFYCPKDSGCKTPMVLMQDDGAIIAKHRVDTVKVFAYGKTKIGIGVEDLTGMVVVWAGQLKKSRLETESSFEKNLELDTGHTIAVKRFYKAIGYSEEAMLLKGTYGLKLWIGGDVFDCDLLE